MNQTKEDIYRASRIRHWDYVANWVDTHRNWGCFYRRKLKDIYRNIVPEGMRVLEIGCGQGDLLAALKPACGIGVDFSSEMIARARIRHPDLEFCQADVHELELAGTFDFIILSDLINDLWDVQAVFEKLKRFCNSRSRIVLNTYSRLWEMPLALARRMNLTAPSLIQNWLTVEDVENLLNLAGFEMVKHWEEILWPLDTPVLEALCNRFMVRLWPLRIFHLCHIIVARPCGFALHAPLPRVSVIVPARNEEGNITAIVDRIPDLGAGTEIIFVEGHSTDGTWEILHNIVESRREVDCRLLRQPGVGKGDAVRCGFAAASGDILMILDADMTVPPEDLARFYGVLVNGRGEFANGVRLVYPMEKEAMRFLNLVGNKFFSLAFSWLLGQPIKDTLCGTKALWKSDYERIAAQRSYFGEFDPFGDFDLLFGASRLNLKIRDVPIRYRERIYGDTNIKRWRHGLLLLRMLVFAMKRLKFI